MKARTWRKRIIASMKAIGSYQPAFNMAIDTLAQILEMRDQAAAQFVADGGMMMKTRMNRVREENAYKNPLVSVIDDLNRQALAYIKELGLTSRSFRLSGGKTETNASSCLIDIMNEMYDDASLDIEGTQYKKS